MPTVCLAECNLQRRVQGHGMMSEPRHGMTSEQRPLTLDFTIFQLGAFAILFFFALASLILSPWPLLGRMRPSHGTGCCALICYRGAWFVILSCCTFTQLTCYVFTFAIVLHSRISDSWFFRRYLFQTPDTFL